MNIQEIMNQVIDELKPLTGRYIKACQGDLFKEEPKMNDIAFVYLNDKIMVLQKLLKGLEILLEIEVKYNHFERYGTTIHNKMEEIILPVSEYSEEGTPA